MLSVDHWTACEFCRCMLFHCWVSNLCGTALDSCHLSKCFWKYYPIVGYPLSSNWDLKLVLRRQNYSLLQDWQLELDCPMLQSVSFSFSSLLQPYLVYASGFWLPSWQPLGLQSLALEAALECIHLALWISDERSVTALETSWNLIWQVFHLWCFQLHSPSTAMVSTTLGAWISHLRIAEDSPSRLGSEPNFYWYFGLPARSQQVSLSCQP